MIQQNLSNPQSNNMFKNKQSKQGKSCQTSWFSFFPFFNKLSDPIKTFDIWIFSSILYTGWELHLKTLAEKRGFKMWSTEMEELWFFNWALWQRG